ncbi:MAG: hypothetical protein COU46_03530 [Candidatus Niyogibacteria bacterium CG10_big_fil_rev_8_21_14_0_10_42_19]|uniref:D-alanyl-D-alanine carboxypeptidase-like core domain-containing protein n=1 Tax=Candidatus Niyogibacteria bacterium CG10_big_fil_rev_8_21_14_0_10_42_19 TaxID=1974725 RepID=A0A2H0TEU4_9BACT|nr:MAG: hypothetical protein COU46_03530 [Candidatus Niyogibacteria bacterium CG10_big_fil_rev_8_21_14_0_10_42_19]
MKIDFLGYDKVLPLLFFLALFIGASGFAYKAHTLNQNNLTLQKELKEAEEGLVLSTKNFTEEITALADSLKTAERDRDIFEENFIAEKARMDFLAAEISSIQSAVGLIEKINSTDRELLQKYSKIFFLNEHYVPQKLVAIGAEYLYEEERPRLIHEGVFPFLMGMLNNARVEGIDILIISAFRSFEEQSGLKSSYSVTYGSGANQFSADQGYSEHQLGTAVDFTTSKTGTDFYDFKNTQAYLWLQENAYKYGFILSYPEDNLYYRFEPWHWRFVGRELAGKLREDNKYFYDLDQREINLYIASFFD